MVGRDRLRTALAALLALSLLPATASGEPRTWRAGPDGYREALGRLKPGDRLELEAGVYTQGLPLARVAGAPDRPIVIEGPASGRPALFVARPAAHTITLGDSAHLVVRNLELDGRGHPVAAVRCGPDTGGSHHITLENLRIHGHGSSQGTVGISTFCTAWNWVIRGNVIAGAGTGLYLGGSEGDLPFIAGLVEGNVVVDSIGYNLQIKHQRVRPELPGMPAGPSRTVIRHNVFGKSRNASTGPMARPNVLVGHFPPSGPGAEDEYAIYGNLFADNPSEALLQGEGRLAVYANLFVNPHGDAINIRPHNDVPRSVAVFRNTIIARGQGISLTGLPPGVQPLVAANAVYAGTPLTGAGGSSNTTAPFEAAADDLTKPFGPPGELNAHPRPGQLRGRPGDLPDLLPWPDAGRDFEGRPYDAPVHGAFAGPGEEPLPAPGGPR